MEHESSILYGPVNALWHSVQRSEEHTSELQSPCNLVCRLLLEKKKERRQRERRRIEEEATALHHEAEQPAAVAEQKPDRVQRATHRQHGKGSGGLVLAQVGQTRDGGRQGCEHDCDGGACAHSPPDSRLDADFAS